MAFKENVPNENILLIMQNLLYVMSPSLHKKMRLFLAPYLTKASIPDDDAANLQSIIKFIEDSHFFWEHYFYVENKKNDVITGNTISKNNTSDTLSKDGVFQQLLLTYRHLKRTINKTHPLLSMSEIQEVYPSFKFHPFVDLLPVIENFETQYAITTADKNDLLNNSLTTYYQEHKKDYLKESQRFNRSNQVQLKKTNQLLDQFLQSPCPTSLNKHVYFFRLELRLPVALPLAITLTIVKKIQNLYTHYFNGINKEKNDNRVQAIRKIHWLNGKYAISFIGLGFYGGVDDYSHSLTQQAVSLNEHIKQYDQAITCLCTGIYSFIALKEKGRQVFNVDKVQNIRDVAELIICSDYCFNVALPGVRSFGMINSQTFEHLATLPPTNKKSKEETEDE